VNIQSSTAPSHESLAKYVGDQARTANGQPALDQPTLEQVADQALEPAAEDASPAGDAGRALATYGSNARPAYTRTSAASISLLA
jgi:hypothetical protein